MTETLDQAEILPRSVPIVNRFRMQHGDLEGAVLNGRITSAWAPDKTIMGWMLKKGFLEEYHKAAAMALLELRHAFLGRLGIKSNSIMLEMTGMVGIEPKDVQALYDIVHEAIGSRTERVIVEAATELAENNKAVCNAECGTVYRAQFDSLLKVLDMLKKSLEDEAK